MRNNLFDFWATVIKKYLKTKEYRNNDNDLDLILQGDLYSLPHTLEEKYKVNDKGYDFFEDLFKKIKAETENNIDWNDQKSKHDLSSVKLKDYHGIVYNSGYKFDKRIKEKNFEILKLYIQGEKPIKVKKPIIDWWQVRFLLLSLVSCSLIGYFWYKSEHPVISDSQKDEAYLKLEKQDSTHQAIIKGFTDDKYGTFIEPANTSSTKFLVGKWYSYNKSNEPKKANNGDKKPFCRVTWNIKDSLGRILLDRTYKSKDGNTFSAFGIIEMINNVYHFHVKVLDHDNNLLTKRHFICNKVPGTEDKLECLCTMFNTQTQPDNPLLIGREILVRANASDTLKSRDITFDELPSDVGDYFKDGIPSYIQMIKEDTERLKKRK